MNIFEAKTYPLNYSTDALRVINMMSFKEGGADIAGSSGIRSQQYAGDFDLFETVKVKKVEEFVKRFQILVAKLSKADGCYVGDIKCGEVPEWKVSPDNAETKLAELHEKGIISADELKEAKAVLTDPLTAKKEIKFDVIRWKPSEVEVGFVILRDGRKMTLAEAVLSGGLVKLDVVAWLGMRYVEFSIIYDVYVNGKRCSSVKMDFPGSLKEDLEYFKKDNPFKYLKRRFSLAKYEGDEKKGEELSAILNGDLGRLYLLSSDIATLLYLLENFDRFDEEHIHKELSGFRMRMGNVYSIPAFLTAEPKFLQTLWDLEHKKFSVAGFQKPLEEMKNKIDKELANATRPHLKGMGSPSKLNIIKGLKLDRRRMNAPKAVVERAIADVKKMESIPLKHKMSPQKASEFFWGENPVDDVPSVAIDLPIIEIDKLYEREIRKKAVFHSVASLKKEGFRIITKGCIVVHKGEIITIYLNSDNDPALKEGGKHLEALGKQFLKYLPRKKPTFYTKNNIFSRDKAEQKRILDENRGRTAEDRYYGWNALDGMMRYFSGNKKQVILDYHPRSPEAMRDNDFLYNLIYSYNAIYALEKRYAPAVAKYRLQKAEAVDKAETIPGDPLKYLPATSLGTSSDFASALHDDSGIRGITETIFWSKTTGGAESYFVNDKAKLAFDISKKNAIVLIPPKISHGTAHTGEHGGFGFVIITKANQVANTELNKEWYKAWKQYFAHDAKGDF